MLITKVTEVSFGPPKDYMLQNLKMINQIFKTSIQLQMIGLPFIFVHIQSLRLQLFFISAK